MFQILSINNVGKLIHKRDAAYDGDDYYIQKARLTFRFDDMVFTRKCDIWTCIDGETKVKQEAYLIHTVLAGKEIWFNHDHGEWEADVSSEEIAILRKRIKSYAAINTSRYVA
jgi:hypothetical protein